MALLRRRFLVLALLLVAAVGGSGSSSSNHSLRYFYTMVSEPSQNLPQFISVGFVDDQPISHYDSVTRRNIPLVSWMEKVGEEDPQFWERTTQLLHSREAMLRGHLVTLQDRNNQQNSTKLHTWQEMYGCEMGPNGQLSRGFRQYAFDGEDFITLDLKNLTWKALVPQALETKSKWDGDEILKAQRFNTYLEEECMPGLQGFLTYGKESLERTERPIPRVACKKDYGGRETLFCQLYGFYPKEVEVTWTKNGEDQNMETVTGGVVPNSDGTYYTWIGIDVDSKEKDQYRCRVGHDSLLEPLNLAWKEEGEGEASASTVGLTVGVLVIGVLVAILVGAGLAVYIKLHSPTEGGYSATPGE